jgi:hypothetical protein
MPNTEGLACKKRCGAFTCWDCLQQSFKMALKPGAIQGCCSADGDLLCSEVKCRHPISVQNLAPEAVLEAHEALKLKVVVAKEVDKALKHQRVQLEAEYLRIEKINNTDEKVAAKLHLKIVNEVLTLRCPRCQTAFLDFDGCFALRCWNDTCCCGICAWCLKDCGFDAHSHVRVCPERQGEGYYSALLVFENHHRRRKASVARALIQQELGENKTATALLKEMLRKELAALKIPIDDLFPEN